MHLLCPLNTKNAIHYRVHSLQLCSKCDQVSLLYGLYTATLPFTIIIRRYLLRVIIPSKVHIQKPDSVTPTNTMLTTTRLPVLTRGSNIRDNKFQRSTDNLTPAYRSHMTHLWRWQLVVGYHMTSKALREPVNLSHKAVLLWCKVRKADLIMLLSVIWAPADV